MNLIFVYGTLKAGFYNHNIILKNEKLIGPFTTFEKYPLVLTHPWFSPVMFPEPGIGHHVYGELYEVSDEKIQELDIFEYSHMPRGFKRHDIRLVSNTGKTSLAQAYLRPRKYVGKICSNYLRCYTDNQYIDRTKR